MKKCLTGILYIIGAVLIWIGPNTIFRVCNQGEMKMKCYWSTRAEAGIAALLAVAALILLLSKDAQIGRAFYLMLAAINVVGILIPALLIGGCPNHMMPCQKAAFPAFYLIHGILLVVSLVSLKKDHGTSRERR